MVSAQIQTFIDHNYQHLKDCLNAAFKIAVEANDLALVQHLVALGADVKEHPDSLVTAVANGRLEITKYLIESGLDVESSTESLLQLAVQSGQVAMVAYLAA